MQSGRYGPPVTVEAGVFDAADGDGVCADRRLLRVPKSVSLMAFTRRATLRFNGR